MSKIFLGYQNLGDTSDEKDAQKKKVDGFVATLLAAGFPEHNISTESTGVSIDTTGTILTVKQREHAIVTTQTLCYGEIVLAASKKQPFVLASIFVTSFLNPEAINELPKVLQLDATNGATAAFVGMGPT